MISFFEFFTCWACPNCKKNWLRKYVKNQETKDIAVEYAHVHKRDEINQIDKKYYSIFRCLKCFKEYAEVHSIISEQELAEMNRIKEEEKNKLKPIVIENVDETKLLDDDEMMRLIGR